MATPNLTLVTDEMADDSPPAQHGRITPETSRKTTRPTTWVPRELLHARVSHTARLVYLALADAADNDSHLLTVDRDALARRCGTEENPMPSRTLERALKDLTESGLMIVVSPASRSRRAVIQICVKSDRRLVVHLGYFWDGHGQPLRYPDAARAVTGLLAILNLIDHSTNTKTARNSAFASAVPGRRQGKNASKNRAARHEGPRASGDTFSGWVATLMKCAPIGTVTITRTRRADGNFNLSDYRLAPEALPPYQKAATVTPAQTPTDPGARLRALPGWRFMTKATRAAITADEDHWPRPVLDLTARLRDGVQALRDEAAATSAHDVMVSPSWLHTMAECVGQSGLSLEALTNIMDFALASPFERANLLGNRHSTAADKFREHVPRLALAPEYAVWREINGHVQYPAEVHDLCESMVDLLEYIHAGDKHEIDWRWRPVARDLLKRYTVEEIEDMMVWSATSPRHITDVGSLLRFGWVADSIRRDNDFIDWAQQKERRWALAHRLPEAPTGSTAASNGKARGQRIGARTSDNEVFKKYAEQTRNNTTRSDSEIAARRADYMAKHPKNRPAAVPTRSRPGFDPIGSVDD